jgi:glutamate carboxypeptidase
VNGVGADLLARLRGQRGRMIEFLERLAVIESPSSDAGTHSAVRALLADAFTSLGFLTVELTGRSSGGQLYARPLQRDRSAPRQLLIGHFDTVWPVGTLGDMPFRVDGDVVRGPGVFDMKGGLVQIVFALDAIRELGLAMSVTPVVFLNSDEEIGSRESTRHIVQLARISDRALILEPSLGPAGAIKTARKGVGRYVVTVKGRAAHAGLDPEQGASAILELSFVIQKLFQLNDPERGVTVNVGTIDGGLRPNVIAPQSKAVIDVRVATHEDAERVHAEIHALEPTPRNQALWRRAKALGRELGLDLAEARAGGGSDGNTTSLYTARLEGLGPVGDGAHAHHEHLNIDRTIERTALLALLLLSPALEEY